MPTGLTLTQEQMQEQMQSWLEQITNAPAPNAFLRSLLSTSETTFNINASRRMFVPSYGFQVHRSEGVVQMSNIDSVASWDGHEPEDL